MRILFLSTDSARVPPDQYGGIERVLADVASGMTRGGHAVALLAMRGSHLDDVRCSTWDQWPGFPTLVSHGLQALKTAREFDADLIHSFGETKWIVPWCLAGGRALLSYGALPQPRVKHVVRLFRGKMLLAGCSQYIATTGEAIVGGRWRTVYNCIDAGRYEATDRISPDAPLVFLSRIDRVKGPHLAIEIARKTGRQLIIAGNHSEEGDSGRYWREEIQPYLNGSIVYVGPVNDRQKNSLLGKAAALVVPIQWDEPFGVVFIEALACGTPVISFARGAVPEIVRNGLEGFVGNSLDELIDGVGQLDRISRRGCRQRFEENFTTNRAIQAYEGLYSELMQ